MRADGVVGPVNGGFLGRSRHRGWRALAFAVAVGLSALSALALAGSAAALPSNCTPSGNTVACTFAYTGGAQTWTVPAGVTNATFDVQGAQGGDVDTNPGVIYTTGGPGGEATADLPLSPDATVMVLVGGQGGSSLGCGDGVPGAGGFNGGAPAGDTGPSSCPGGGGGGASDVRIGGSALSDRALVAGGGGGGANAVCIEGGQANGGAGGGLSGGAGSIGNGGCGSPVGGSGGNQTGTSGSGQLGVGSAGSGAFANGAGGGGVPGGGGGGGYYGGAGGGDDTSGGGGSGFGPAATTFNTGVRSGDGVITVTYTVQPPAPTTIKPAPQVILPGFSGVGLLRVSATLSSGNTVLAGETVAFTVGKTKLCSAQTNTLGVATCSIGVLQEVSVLLANSYTASFGGDSSHTGSTASTPAVTISRDRGLARTSTRHAHGQRHESALQALSSAHGHHADQLRARITEILSRERH